jgi:AraC family transcriptional regulator, regulatory protein of adaptative response / DNA-3-methyladenine glycosylase II
VELDFDLCYRAVDSRDSRFDGWFVTAVSSTGIYCRPSCPATTPKRANVTFYPSAAAAQRSGFRACRRCRPDAAPGSPEWDIRADVVGRAMRLIADGVVDREGVPGLAARLGYTPRHLHRMLVAQLGAGPLALARAQRAQTARILVETTDLGLAEIAFAAGFGSVRQFNDTLREVFAVAPSQLRAARKATPGGQATPAGQATPGERATPAGKSTGLSLRLPYRAPLHAEALLEFLAARAIEGVEEVTGEAYRRALRLPHGTGTATLAPRDGYLLASLQLADLRDLAPAVARCRRLLDLDADPVAIDAAFAEDPAFAPLIRKEPGVRVPRAVDGFEIAVRAVVGQQVSVAGARKVIGRLVQTQGDDLVPFPDPASIAGAPDDAFRMPAARRATLRALAEAVGSGAVILDPGADREQTEAALRAIPGIGEWTARYIALRALGDPDVFLPTDLGVRRSAARLGLPDNPKLLDEYARRWRPWRSYAVIRLWRI